MTRLSTVFKIHLDKIDTRFDAAREYLKLSLRSLKPEQYFCVIFFGTEASPIKTTKGPTQATASNIKKCISELDRIKKGNPESNTRHADRDGLIFPGPYGYRFINQYLPDDVRRLNLFKKCEIHSIGIDNVSHSLLQTIADAGNGVVKMIGN